MQVNPGIFKKKIEIIEYEIKKDADGFEIKTEILVVATKAQVTNSSGTELQRSNSDFSETKTRFFIRTPKQKLDTKMMIKFDGEIYNILYVNDYSYEKKYTEIMAKLVKK